MERFPIIVTAGAALLGFVAGEMAATDPLLARFDVDEGWHPYALGGILAGVVVAAGTLLNRRSTA
jgi:predicted tellurium resistance membrane protein TerC